MRAPPLPLEDRQDLVFFNLMVRALTTPPRLSDVPHARAPASPAAHLPSPLARLDAWLAATRRHAAVASPVAAGNASNVLVPSTPVPDRAWERAVVHPYY